MDGLWYYMVGGQFEPHTGLVPYDGAVFYFVDGILALNFTGIVADARSVHAVVNGQAVD